MKNSFKLKNALVSIEGGFIPNGAEYTSLSNLVESKTCKSGKFDMQFTNNNQHGFTAKVLTVSFIKP